MNTTPLLEMKNVSIELGGKSILENINLTIYEHETVVFIGPSGGGKTVLLKTLAGIYKPVKGQVLIEGEDWQNLESEDKHRLAKKLGMLFQQSALFDTMSAIDNVKFPMREHCQFSEEELTRQANEFLTMVNLQESAHKLPSELSGGMQRRLGIARAIALHPHIIFYDDPTAGQDPIQTYQMTDLITKLKVDNQATLIMTTSNMKVARKMADRIFMVVHKGIIDAGKPSELDGQTNPIIKQFINGEIEGPLKVL
jgi:phospholipid/cholesterol/gamma-HCH transport system ATP-binding protein